MITGSQNLGLWYDTDNVVTVTMVTPADVTAWALSLEIFQDGVGVFTHKTVTKVDAVNGVFSSIISPDLDHLDIDQKYHFRFLRTDSGGRDVLAWGGINLKKLR